mmetsp:Transcript_30375/g.90017  ORF Transcript_30375/g.90017 Transcript_30375/m.90017 type:complete len:130 (-) Transcript_30375:59-448(-)|eukprot:CAMPEP_0175208074 /NCGR_PEP_ID=MMETSP0093-20121207/13437_1 /TAXON_ID=311494 /ORGANISM="Alexandrium monilatum, Strain CCMP3105" /LENGTH=129 /DNA_ID=CAMNT_0016501251 /DNA_START=83 /DNA_END=472 /DNA_ORIENTATION=-
MSGLNESMMSTATRKPTGMKGKVHDLAATLQNQNDELNIDKGRLRAVLDDSSNSNSGMQGRINTMKNYFDAEVNRMLEDFKASSKMQEGENVRLQSQVTQLKGEKTSIHQQIIALQRRIEEIEEEIGHE